MIIKKNYTNMNSDLLFIFFSGFGSDFEYWNNLIPYFKDYNCLLLAENYFNDGDEISEMELMSLCNGKRIIAIGHSLGYMKLCLLQEKYDFLKFEKIVVIEGFSNYLGTFQPIRIRRKIILDFMKFYYKLNPVITLIIFQLFCGAFPNIPKEINRTLLLDDLNLLDKNVTSPNIPHLVLSSFNDPVIPFYIIEDNFSKTNDTRIMYTNFCGHLLGMYKPWYVYEKIIKFSKT